MKNPVEVERKFNDLIHELRTSPSNKYQWNCIDQFLTNIKDELSRFDTYVLQLIPYLPVIENPISYAGTDPEDGASMLELLSYCEEQIPTIKQQDRYLASRDALLKSVCLLFAIVGDFERLIDLFGLVHQKESKLGKIVRDKSKYQEDHQKRTTYIAELARAQSYRDLADFLDQIYEIWNKELQEEPHSILIPVVERHSSGKEFEEGRIRRMEAKITGERSERKDTISNNFVVVGAEQPKTGDTGNIEQAVRMRLNRAHPQLRKRFFDVLLSYKLQNGWQIGYSSGPGAACISYAAILDYSGCRETYSVNSNIAITGKLNANGMLSSVDERSIRKKAEAVFFSWSNMLVVPTQQEEKFKSAIKKLAEKYPKRTKIKIIGIDDINELFFDRRITSHQVQSRPQYYLQQAWEQKFSIAGVVIILILLLLIIRLLYGPIDKNPVNGVFKGEHLFVENQYGQTLARLDAGFRADDQARSNSSKGGNPEVKFADINSDNINEVFWVTNTANNEAVTEKISSWSVSGDSLVWELPLSIDLEFPRKSGMVDENYIIGGLSKETLPNGKTYIIVESTMREMFPGVIVQLQAATGNIENKYVHTGMIGDIELIDLAGDEVREVIFTGLNNAFSNAVVGVLDLRKFGGHSPLKGDYIMENVDPAKHLHYLLIPKTKVGRYLNPISYYNVSHNINLGQDSLISVEVTDGDATPFEGIERDPRIYAFFDYNLQPLGFSTSDKYDIVSEKLYREGKIDTIPDYDYFEAFKDSILYWNGEQFKSRIGVGQATSNH